MKKLLRKILVNEIHLVRSERNGMIYGCFFDKEKAMNYVNKQRNMWIQTENGKKRFSAIANSNKKKYFKIQGFIK